METNSNTEDCSLESDKPSKSGFHCLTHTSSDTQQASAQGEREGGHDGLVPGKSR